ncbi:glycosyltransferase family 39 protein [candidate division KSB1 bacterium]|nr:glycosyltransferase family 39 protein [candidate division KSB1 bacterium]
MVRLIKKFFNSPEKTFVSIVILLALLVRIGYVLTLEEKWYYYDTVHYDTAAQNLVQGNGFGPSLYFANLYAHYCLEPLYPLFLAGVYAVFGHSLLAARIVQVLLSLLGLLVLYGIGRSLVPQKVVRAALVFAGIYPFFIYIPGLLYITQLFSLFILLSVYGFLKFYQQNKTGWIIFAGLFLGLAVLARPIYLFGVPLFFLWLLWAPKFSFGRKLLFAAILGLTILVVFTPWTVRNYKVFGKAKFARACLPQDQIYGKTFWTIAREKAAEKDSIDVSKFSVWYHEENDQSIFDCYLDDEYFFTLLPYEKITIPDSGSYFGVVFSGPESNRIERLTAKQRSAGQDEIKILREWDSFDSLTVAFSSKSVKYDKPGVYFEGGTIYWQYPLVFAEKINANYFEMQYPQPVTPQGLRKAALLIFLDKPDTTANGFMIWLHPWEQPDLWWFKDGKPWDGVPVRKTFTRENSVNLFYLFYHYPFEFIFKHFIPEFLNFWSPKITRVISEERQPGTLMQIVSILFFSPLLLLFPFGIWALRKKIKLLALFLIPVITLSIGYSIYFTQTRYRIPVDGFIILFAMQGWYYIISKMVKHQHDNQ